MERMTYMEIGGKKYPLSFSLAATKAISKKFGSVKKMGEKISNIEDVNEETVDAIAYILAVLVAQGCAYKNVFEKDIPAYEGAPVDGEGKYIPLNQEEIEIGINMTNIGEMARTIMGTFTKSGETEIETEVPAGKNAEAPEA